MCETTSPRNTHAGLIGQGRNDDSCMLGSMLFSLVDLPNPAWVFLGNVVSHMGTHTHSHIRRMRSVCNQRSKILQHHRIITGSHTHSYTLIRRMRFICNHHSKILQHHRIITGTHTHSYGLCDTFVIITPRFSSIRDSTSIRFTEWGRYRLACP